MNKLIIVALLSGLGSGITVALVMPQAGSEVPIGQPGSSNEASTTSNTPAIPGTVKALEDDLRSLRARLTKLESARADSTAPKRLALERVPRDAEGEDETDEGNRPRTASPVAHIVEALESDESPLRVAVQGMINDSMENRRQEWRAVGRAAREARDQDKLKGFLAKVDVNEEQVDALSKALVAERTKLGDEWRSARKNMQFEGMRERMRSIRQQTDEDLSEVLSTGQLEEWRVYRKENWGRRRNH